MCGTPVGGIFTIKIQPGWQEGPKTAKMGYFGRYQNTPFWLVLTHLVPLLISDPARADVNQGGEQGRSDLPPKEEVCSTEAVDTRR